MRLVRSVLVVVVTSSVLAVAPGAQAAPTPVASCNFTATTDVKLTTDLICPGTYGIVVGAHGITIDLGGHTLTGDRTADRHGILNHLGFDGVTVRNGTLTKFSSGVFADGGADGMRVTNVVASGNAGNGILIIGNSARVSSSHASGNAFSGIHINGDSARVSSSEASGNAGDGISIQGASARVSSSEAPGNAGNGIRIVGDSARVSSSEASGNAFSGIFISATSGRVSSSRASGNTFNGIVIFGDSARVSSSQASGNAGNAGIYIDGDSARVRSSRVSGNAETGIRVSGDAPKIGRLPGGRTRDRNRAEANGFPNGASDGVGLGILADGFTTAPAGRNVARGNDGPAQCNPSDLCQTVPVPTPGAGCNVTADADIKLTTDLFCPGTAGIVVGADGVTIDLNGHTLTGNRTANNHGIDNTAGFDNVTVRNGTVTKFDSGVRGDSADGMRVSKVLASGNAGIGIHISGASGRVSSSQVSGNVFAGIHISGASGRVSSSQVSGNGQDGILIFGTSARVSSSRTSGNDQVGIRIVGDSGRVSSSRVSGNAGNGIAIDGDSGRVSSSQVSGNTDHGIVIFGDSARVSSSRASGNGKNGILIFGDSARVRSSQASGNASNDGIRISGDAPKIGKLPGGRSKDKNRAEANGFPGGVADTVGLGIFASGFTTAPVGRNVARGNDNPAQCNPSNLC